MKDEFASVYLKADRSKTRIRRLDDGEINEIIDRDYKLSTELMSIAKCLTTILIA